MNNRPTPETDKYAKADWWTLFRATEHCRILERERDEARAAMREAWLACMRVDVRLALVEWRNKHASILEEVK